MPLVIRPTTTIIKEQHFTTQTERGEVTVNINLKLSLEVNGDGELSLKAEKLPDKKVVDKEISDFVMQIPDEETGDLIDFGKEI